jgi:hypothetical protein
MGGRQLEISEADTLLRERKVGPLEGFRSRLGRPFTASIKLNDANEVSFDFGDGSSDDSAEAPDFTGLEPLGPCPKCGSRVFELPQAYVCEKAVGPDKTCDFRSGRVILQRPIERAQMQKLLATGKTDLLQFVSARTKRGFSAFLVRQPVVARSVSSSRQRKRARAGARRSRAPVCATRAQARIRADKKPVELRRGTLWPVRQARRHPMRLSLDRDKADSVTLLESVAFACRKRKARSVPQWWCENRAHHGVRRSARPVAEPDEVFAAVATAKRTHPPCCDELSARFFPRPSAFSAPVDGQEPAHKLPNLRCDDRRAAGVRARPDRVWTSGPSSLTPRGDLTRTVLAVLLTLILIGASFWILSRSCCRSSGRR